MQKDRTESRKSQESDPALSVVNFSCSALTFDSREYLQLKEGIGMVSIAYRKKMKLVRFMLKDEIVLEYIESLAAMTSLLGYDYDCIRGAYGDKRARTREITWEFNIYSADQDHQITLKLKFNEQGLCNVDVFYEEESNMLRAMYAPESTFVKEAIRFIIDRL